MQVHLQVYLESGRDECEAGNRSWAGKIAMYT
jgi:hypothetical protein